MRPKFKEIMKPVVVHQNVIRIGLETDSYEIDDSDGVINEIIELLDGKRDILEISEVSSIPVNLIEECIHALNEIGCIEDDSIDPYQYINEKDLERYRANLTFYTNFTSLEKNKFEFQKNIKDSTVAILGLGGASLGVACLTGLGVENIIGVDYDLVETSNLNRQFLYSEKNIGELKTEATLNRLKELNSDVNFKFINKKIKSSNDLNSIIKEADIVINAIDSPAILCNRWVNAACVKQNIPFIQGGVSNTQIMWERIVPNQSGCYDCYLIHALRIDPFFEYQLKAIYNNHFPGRNVTTGPHVALLNGFMTSEVAKLLSGYTEAMPASTTMIYDKINIEIKKNFKWDKLPDCPTCGKGNENIEPVSLEELISIAKQGTAVQ